jgi:predicted GNAT superfamily acetyltransferase
MAVLFLGVWSALFYLNALEAEEFGHLVAECCFSVKANDADFSPILLENQRYKQLENAESASSRWFCEDYAERGHKALEMDNVLVAVVPRFKRHPIAGYSVKRVYFWNLSDGLS